jgi:hypothetical protein
MPKILLATVLFAFVPRFAQAECIILTAQDVMANKFDEIVFSGVVVSITRTAPFGYRATFEVDRVWKGSVSRKMDLYVWELAGESARFAEGQTYVAIGRRLTDKRARQGVGLTDDRVVFTASECLDALERNIREGLGTGSPPR